MNAVRLIRWGVPVVMVLGGTAVAVTTNEGVGESIIGGAAIVVLGNWMLRLNAGDAGERRREEAAREFYDEHGRWPDDET